MKLLAQLSLALLLLAGLSSCSDPKPAVVNYLTSVQESDSKLFKEDPKLEKLSEF